MSETRSFEEFARHPYEITEQVCRSEHRVILAESSFVDLVLMPRSSYENYEDNKALDEIYSTLQQRALQAETTETWVSRNEVMRGAQAIIKPGYEQADV